MTAAGPTPQRLFRVTMRWSPVWIPLLLLWQISTRGLAPALAERDRLESERPAVEARHERTENEYLDLKAEHEAWHDPVYRERLRRLREARARR